MKQISSLTPLLIGFLGSVLFTVLSFMFEPRLLPLAAFAGPALIGLVFPPNGRQVYRDLAIAALIASTVISTMLFMPSSV